MRRTEDALGENITGGKGAEDRLRLLGARKKRKTERSARKEHMVSASDHLKQKIADDLDHLSEAELTYVLSHVEACLLTQQSSPAGRAISSQENP